MPDGNNIGKFLIITGLFIVAIGLLILLIEKVGFHPFRLPGDIVIKGKNFRFYFPIISSILLSLLLTLLFYILSKFK